MDQKSKEEARKLYSANESLCVQGSVLRNCGPGTVVPASLAAGGCFSTAWFGRAKRTDCVQWQGAPSPSHALLLLLQRQEVQKG